MGVRGRPVGMKFILGTETRSERSEEKLENVLLTEAKDHD